jgi:methyl-accepting chemotaxis protein
MSRVLTFGRRIALGFALAILVVALMGLVAYRSTGLVAEASGWVAHTHEVIALLSDIDDRLTDAESADRGFALTGNEAFLDLYEQAKREIPPLLRRLREVTASNEELSRQIDELEPAAMSRLAFSTKVIETRRKEGLDTAAALVTTGEGRRQMRNVRALIARMAGIEQRLLRQRNEAAAQAVRAARLTTLFGVLAGILLVTTAGVLITRSLTSQVSAAIQRLQSSAAELETAASQQATTAKEQATATTEITTTVRELLATSRQIAESTQRVARLAEQTGGAAAAGEGTLSRANEGMGTIRRQVDAIVQHMVDLGHKSKQISVVLELINELSEQTNILAINATIEAAGAAEAGRRFAAVADEIRKLADRVGASTKEIRVLVDDVKGAASTTVAATEEGAAATDAGTRQFDELAEGFKEISTLVVETTEASREIELSTRQQATAVEQVNGAMLDVARSAEEVDGSSRQTVQIAAELVELSRALARIVRPNRGHEEGERA